MLYEYGLACVVDPDPDPVGPEIICILGCGSELSTVLFQLKTYVAFKDINNYI
jgi:hypothetical protein